MRVSTTSMANVTGVLLCLLGAAVQTNAAETVDTGANLRWVCEEGLHVKLSGNKLTVQLRNPKLQVTMHLDSCNSSHCAWQTSGRGDDCNYRRGAPLCAVITAGSKSQNLLVRGTTPTGLEVDGVCTAIKDKETWGEPYYEDEQATETAVKAGPAEGFPFLGKWGYAGIKNVMDGKGCEDRRVLEITPLSFGKGQTIEAVDKFGDFYVVTVRWPNDEIFKVGLSFQGQYLSRTDPVSTYGTYEGLPGLYVKCP